MSSGLVVFIDPEIEIGLKLSDSVVNPFAERDAVELVEQGLVEPLEYHWSADFSSWFGCDRCFPRRDRVRIRAGRVCRNTRCRGRSARAARECRAPRKMGS